MTIRENVKIIQEQLNQIANKADPHPQDNSNIFKYALISRIIQAGGTLNTEMQNQETGDDKKFFAFKFDPMGDVENQILYYIQRMFNLIDQSMKDNLDEDWSNLEFNIPKLDNLKDKDSFIDLYRGLVLYRRKV